MRDLKRFLGVLFFIIAVSFIAPAADADISYTVRKGDTLTSIAKKYRITINELKKTNNLKNTGKLRVGRRIVIKSKRHTPDTYTVRATTRAATLARLKKVRELSMSEDMLAGLSMNERLILFAKKMLHIPYRFGGNGAVGLDCSAYVQRVFSLAGRNIPRSAREQFGHGEVVEKENMEAGDLVFFQTYASFPSHVGIYLGNNLFIHASSRSKKVTIDNLDTPFYIKRFIGAKRIITDTGHNDGYVALLQGQGNNPRLATASKNTGEN